ncbi:sarcosine oxidase subunit gamma [Prosthecodimorpha staleyi]|uniref:Sarcosine oxidase subunit gamma n=1 Tax=Prosthecodimorpha staleyi TaxID=2840188 RepID=A0A947D0Z6_9HYPH|nr:sarcosine oxidase subunit gamma family protein [Prosthecodimorpha staleyi]MBT9288248.1 sarcosine oxidase subunit gamma [Prosthecodimorpha staleyi]
MPDAVTARPFETGFAAIVAPRSRAAAARSRFAETFGFALPEGPRLARAGDLMAFGIGVDHWVAAAPGDGWALERRLADALGETALVTDQTDAREGFRIEGPAARLLLETGCSLDLHASVFPAGAAAVTEIAGMPVWLWTEDAASFRIAVSRSYAESFAQWLDHAVASTRARVAAGERAA